MDAADFAAFHLPAIAAQSGRYGMLNQIVSALARRETEATRWWSLGAPGACAVCKENRPLVIGDADDVQCRALLEATRGLWFRAVQGVPQSVTRFVRHAGGAGLVFAPAMRFGYHQLSVCRAILT